MSKAPKKEGALDIFVVDDHEDIAEGLADVLRVHGHNVTVAYNGEQAVRIFRDHDFDLAFMDVMMPGMNGVESFLEIRKMKPDAKVIMMTGYSVEQLLDQAIDSGAYGVLHKPVSIGEVLEALERVKSQGMVLVADDDPEFSENIKEVLQDEGYRVCMARTGRQALNAVLAGGIDILVLDLRLPVVSGLEVYLELQKRGRALPTVVVTGYSRQEAKAIDTLSSLSSTGILTKPFDSKKLLDALNKIADSPEEAGAPAEAPEAAELAPIHASEDHAAEAPQPANETDTSPNLADFVQPPEKAKAPEEPPRADSPAPAEDKTAAAPATGSTTFSIPLSRSDIKPQAEETPFAARPAFVAAERSTKARSEVYAAKRGRILAVDDDEDLVTGLAEVLETQGYQVEVALDADAAQKAIRKFDAQVALLDIRLGNTNGLDLIPILKESQPNIYCVVITGNADRESAITALRNGAYDYMSKPLHPSELFSVVDRCLEKHRLQQEAMAAFDALQIAKDAAEAANRAKTDFMAKMSQELRNPVNAIIGSSNILIDETWGPIGQPQYADHARKIRENGSQLLRIVGFALEMAKADVGSLELNEEPVDICRLVQSAINLVQDTVADDAPPIEIEVPDTAPMVWGDERQLKQILINLLSNAVKFTPADGRISLNIRWNDADGGIDIEVGDTGIGMTEEDIPKALEQFGRIESQAFREYKGAGLGLPMVVAMAERHGGKLRLESELGKGTIATVWLPDGRIFSAEPEAADSAIA